MRDPDSLRHLADAIADSQPIDWASASVQAEPRDLDTLAELQVIAEIARFHHEQASMESPGPALMSPRDVEPDVRDRQPLFTLGPLQVLEHLGAGAFGDVYRAWDSTLAREVALKLLRVEAGPRAAEAMAREGQLLAKVRHPNVMAVYGAQQFERGVGIWGELLDGRTLADIVNTDGPLSAEEASIFLEPVCRALTAVHRAGLLHRDVKAQNVMRESGGRIVLMDFGLGREVDLPEGMHGLELAGTPPYMAPELFRGEPASAQSDIYSVGVLAFHLVTGRFPIEGKSLSDVAARHAAGKRTRLEDLRSDLPAAFVQVVGRALDPDRASRFESAGALQNALVGVRQSIHPPAPAPPRPWWIALPIAALSGLAGAALAVFLTRPPSAPAEVLTYSLAAPEGIAFTEGARNVPVISPDGQQIAFIGTELNPTAGRRVSRLYVWPLAEPRPRAIAGSEAGSTPFWSADSQSLAFVSTSGGEPALYRVSLSGARSERLASLWETRGGTWNRDGVFIVAKITSGLYRLAPDGRQVEPLTTVDRARYETAHMWPQFLPDGRRFVFFVQSQDQQHRGIYLGSLDGSPPRRLVFADSSAVYGNGHLLYVSGSTLFAHAFDPDRGLSGTPHAIVPRVDATHEARTIASVSDNGRLVYAIDKDVRQLRWYDPSGKTGADVATGKFRNPALSPHDPGVLAVEWNGDPPASVEASPAAGRNELRLFSLPQARVSPLRFVDAICPVWGPDGQLVFAKAQSGTRLDLMVVRPAAGSTPSLLVRSDENKEATDWSRDGRTVVYQELDGHGRRRLWFKPTSGGPATLAFDQSGSFSWMNGRLSPDGRWLAYSSTESVRRDDPDIFIRELSTGTTIQISEEGGYNPIWRDAATLLYMDPLGWIHEAVALRSRKSPVPRALFATDVITPRTSLRYFDISADGRVLVARPLPSTISVMINWTSRLTQDPR
jgi:Tol biopolymer transport system component